MAHIVRAAWFASVIVATLPARALACGPCTTPEFWGVVPLGETPVLVSNFGLLSPTSDGGWLLTCEETLGSLILGVRSGGKQLAASTEMGLFLSNGGTCGFQRGPRSANSSWFLDIAVADDSTPQTPHLLALVSDAVESTVNLELSRGDDFELLRPLGKETAYRRLETTSDLATIVVAGYGGDPRRWKLGWASGDGASLEEFTPDIDDADATASLFALDPKAPERVFFQLQATGEAPAELWSFESDTQTTKRLWRAPGNSSLTGFAVLGDEVWLATSTSTATTQSGSLFRGALGSLDSIEPSITDAPPIPCLNVIHGELVACGGDYSEQSPFLLAKVDTQKGSFVPLLRVAELGDMKSCGEECSRTTDWLETVYGVLGESPTDTPDVSTADRQTTDESSLDTHTNQSSGCNVSVRSMGLGGLRLELGALLALLLRRRRSVPQHQNPRLRVGDVNMR